MEESKGLSELCTAKLVTQSNKILDASPKNQLTNWVYVTFDNGQSLSDPVEMFL